MRERISDDVRKNSAHEATEESLLADASARNNFYSLFFQLAQEACRKFGEFFLTDRRESEGHGMVVLRFHAEHHSFGAMTEDIAIDKRIHEIGLMKGIAETHTLTEVVVEQSIDAARLISSEYGIEDIHTVAVQKGVHEADTQGSSIHHRHIFREEIMFLQPFKGAYADTFIGEKDIAYAKNEDLIHELLAREYMRLETGSPG